ARGQAWGDGGRHRRDPDRHHRPPPPQGRASAIARKRVTLAAMSERSHPEQHEEASRGAALRNFVFGTSDGLVTVLAFVAGVSASLATRKLVLMAGLAEMFAGAVSMGLGAFLGTRAERDWYERERKREELEVEKIPHLEREELRDIYRKKGLDGETLERVVSAFTANEKRWVDIMMTEELGLQPVDSSPLSAGVVVGFSYVIAAAIPLLP